MLLLRTLLIAALSLPVQNAELYQCSSDTTTYYSPLLDSLQCTNDYTTHVRCTWEEDPNTKTPMLMRLNGSLCVPVNHDVLMPNGNVQRSCVYKTKVFSRGKYTFVFNTPCPSKASTLNIAANGKVLAPVNLSARKINGDDRLLSWSSPYPPSSPLTHTLTYQVKYRRHGQDWTVKDNMSITELKISHSELLPGYTYEARVRARGKVGKWSDWSPPVSWMMEEESAYNLQCVIKEDGVMCSWQVKKEHAQFFSYYLCWYANEAREECKLCPNYTSETHSKAGFLHFSCSVKSSEPEQLNVEIISVHQSKGFSNPYNIKPPRPSPVQAHKKNGMWKLSWSRPNVSRFLQLTYEVRLQRNGTQDYEQSFSLTEGDFSLDVPHSCLMPSTGYRTQVRAVPMYSEHFDGQPSEWSEPTYFTSDSDSWISITIYVFVAVFVTVFSIFLYNALPVCHRRMKLWKVSIPSPNHSKVLEEMNSKKSPAGIANPYSDSEKTSVCIIQSSDNPIICKLSISEYPVLPRNDETDVGFGMIKSGYLHSLSQLSSFTESSRVTDKSGMSFVGPYLLCQNSLDSTEISDMSFSSLSSFDENGIPISESVKHSSPVDGGYVVSPPTTLQSSECPTLSTPATENRDLPAEDPPAYTPSPPGMPGAIFSHPSGYCHMPNMEMSISAWASASTLPLEGNPKWQSYQPGEGDSRERGYVMLSQR